jgi:hypothetical protein
MTRPTLLSAIAEALRNLTAMIIETTGQPIDQSDCPIRRSQQQSSSVRRDRSAIKTPHNLAAANRCKFEQLTPRPAPPSA